MKNKTYFQKVLFIVLIICSILLFATRFYLSGRSDMVGYSVNEILLYNAIWALTDMVIPALLLIFVYLNKKKVSILLIATRCLLEIISSIIFSEQFGLRNVISLLFVVAIILYACNKVTNKNALIISSFLLFIIFVVGGYAESLIYALINISGYSPKLVIATLMNIAYSLSTLLTYICTIAYFAKNRIE